ncbi:hypothetical protein CDD83_3538 [Cordyceps sp. RAO-2017]|nr:hypothetical protein CDD83_3538 [Cordyceps sp. RAO-2017]
MCLAASSPPPPPPPLPPRSRRRLRRPLPSRWLAVEPGASAGGPPPSPRQPLPPRPPPPHRPPPRSRGVASHASSGADPRRFPDAIKALRHPALARRPAQPSPDLAQPLCPRSLPPSLPSADRSSARRATRRLRPVSPPPPRLAASSRPNQAPACGRRSRPPPASLDRGRTV